MGARHQRRRIESVRYCEHQRLVMEDDADVVLVRGGNRLGKSFGLVMDIIHTCRGTHPYQRTPPPPVNVLVLGESWDQMGKPGSLMHRLWEYLPKDEIDPRTRFDAGRGITGKPPRVQFVRGPGRGSVIAFGTYRAGPRVIAGGEVVRVYCDEPPPYPILDEALPRLLTVGGKMRIGFTPVIDMPDQTHLMEMVDKGLISEHNPWLQEANCWPDGNPLPWIDQAKIDVMASRMSEATRRMRIEGWWFPVVTGARLSAFDSELHVRRLPRPPQGSWFGVGIDHGEVEGKQSATLITASGRTDIAPRAWALDEVPEGGRTSTREDALAIFHMLERQGLTWRDIALWVGDRSTRDSSHVRAKSNDRLRRALADLAQVPVREFPKIHVPYKYAGSVDDGLTQINALMATLDENGIPHLLIDERCERLRAFCSDFDGNPYHPTKDSGDSFRYIFERAVRSAPPLFVDVRY